MSRCLSNTYEFINKIKIETENSSKEILFDKSTWVSDHNIFITTNKSIYKRTKT